MDDVNLHTYRSDLAQPTARLNWFAGGGGILLERPNHLHSPEPLPQHFAPEDIKHGRSLDAL